MELLRVDDHVNPASVLAAPHRAGLAEVPFTAVHAADEWSQVTRDWSRGSTVTVSSFADLSAFSRDYRARDRTRRTFQPWSSSTTTAS